MEFMLYNYCYRFYEGIKNVSNIYCYYYYLLILGCLMRKIF